MKEQWLDKVLEEVGEAAADDPRAKSNPDESFDDIAQRLWIKANTKVK
jgi:hypothetical protein